MNKRILSILLCLTLVASLLVLAIPVSAASAKEIAVTADKATAAAGDDVTFTLTLGPVENMGAIQATVVIPEGLTLDKDSVSYNESAVNSTYGFLFSAVTPSDASLLFDGTNFENKTTTTSCDICTFTCKIAADAAEGTTYTVAVDGASLVMGDVENEVSIADQYTLTGATVTVQEPATPDDPTPVDPDPTPVDPTPATPDEPGDDGDATPDEPGIATPDEPGTDATPDEDATPDNATNDSNTPKTGDSTQVYLWVLIMLATLAGAGAVVFTAKRKGLFTK